MIASSYQYRPEAWVSLDVLSASRAANVSLACVAGASAWWGDNYYRGFNISKLNGQITAAEAEAAFAIYVPASSGNAN